MAIYVSGMALGIHIAFEDLGFDIYWALICVGSYHRKNDPDKLCFWKILTLREAITSGSGEDTNIFSLQPANCTTTEHFFHFLEEQVSNRVT